MKNLVFDYDGTLHDTNRIYAPAFRKNYAVLVSKGLMPPREFTDKEISRWLGITAADMWNTFAPELTQAEKEASSQRITEDMRRRIASGEALLYPGIPEILNGLKAEGYRLFILSNCKTAYLSSHRQHFGLDRWFTAYYWGEGEHWATKPVIMRKLLSEFPGETVMIGDRFLDLEAGRENGLPTIACAYGFGSPEEFRDASAIAETPQDLPRLIHGLL